MAMLKQIYLAGGCFWGVEEYFSLIPGVADATSGYANGHTENPSYDDVCHRNTGHAETVRVTYDPSIISLKTLVEQLFEIIDPLSVNRQGNDFGTQYRTGVYYTDESDRAIIEAVFAQEQKKHDAPIATELAPLEQFFAAEECHQDYLRKNPGGYCHVNFDGLAKVKSEAELAGGMPPMTDEQLDEYAEKMRALPHLLYSDGFFYYAVDYAHPNGTGQYTKSSLPNLMMWDAEDRMGLIVQPLLMMAGSAADTLYMTEDAFAKATGTEDKELFLIEGSSHIQTYHVPEYVAQVEAKLVEFFSRTL